MEPLLNKQDYNLLVEAMRTYLWVHEQEINGAKKLDEVTKNRLALIIGQIHLYYTEQ